MDQKVDHYEQTKDGKVGVNEYGQAVEGTPEAVADYNEEVTETFNKENEMAKEQIAKIED